MKIKHFAHAPKIFILYDLKMTVERYTPDNTMPKTDEKFIRK